MAGYHVENFGCRASQADGAAIASQLDRSGLSASPGAGDADVVILNTCSVTSEAERQLRGFLRKTRRANPGARVVVTGCYAQRAPEEVSALPGVDFVVGNSHKALVAEIAARGLGDISEGMERPVGDFVALGDLLSTGNALVDDSFAHADLALAGAESDFARLQGRGLTRPNLKVQDGCGNRCSFCIIPTTRGHSRSVPLDSILDAVHSFCEAGGQEMVLSGINLGRWGRDLPRTPDVEPGRFEGLVQAILERTCLPRLRISSVEPMDWSESLVHLLRAYATGPHPRLARHAHLPLQSGSDAVLRAMHRRYRPWHYEAKVQAIRDTVPEAAIGADVMVGFPGETDALFEETLRFVERQPFTYLHLFPFSARPGTPAWQLQRESPVAGVAVRERMAQLRAVMAEKNLRYRERFVGRTLSAVTIQCESAGTGTQAVSDNFLAIEMPAWYSANRMLQVRVHGVTATGLRGTADPSHAHSPAERPSPEEGLLCAHHVSPHHVL